MDTIDSFKEKLTNSKLDVSKQAFLSNKANNILNSMIFYESESQDIKYIRNIFEDRLAQIN